MSLGSVLWSFCGGVEAEQRAAANVIPTLVSLGMYMRQAQQVRRPSNSLLFGPGGLDADRCRLSIRTTASPPPSWADPGDNQQTGECMGGFRRV